MRGLISVKSENSAVALVPAMRCTSRIGDAVSEDHRGAGRLKIDTQQIIQGGTRPKLDFLVGRVRMPVTGCSM